MAVTIILGTMFKASMPSYRAGFTRSYPHRVILQEDIFKHTRPDQYMAPQQSRHLQHHRHFVLLQHGLLISFIPSQDPSNYYSSPSRSHKSPATSLQNKIKSQ